ncbi:MAG: hydantoinase B/oxoprolinase family protein [Hyphomicrobiales bacterium]|nr:hydantoinase B/oxoprolinase family protein [Hyphomicrobiales bacterium]
MLHRPAIKLRNDPITFEVLRHRLWQINDEQGQTIIRVSGSPVATEGNDFNVAIADADGELIAVGPYIVMHVAAISDVIRNTVAVLGEDTIRAGEMYLVNDPWMGAGHQNDFCVAQPVFWEGRRIAWTASVIHQVDVGGPSPGSWNFGARTTFEEAPRYKALRVVRDGKTQPEVIATVLTNTRLPDLVDLDLRAQIAAANVARERLFELIGRYGVKVVTDSFADLLDYAQAQFRRKLASLHDGSWYAEDHIDHDGHEERTYTVRCRLTKSDDRLHFDFRGTSAQAPGLINTARAGANAGVYSAVFPYLCRSIPWNSGVTRQIEITLDPGTIHNCDFPAPVGYGVVHASWTTLNAAALALGKLLASAEGDEAMAGWAGSTFVYNTFGVTDRGERFATMLLSSDLQGCGARATGDGFDVGGKLNAPRSKVASIESLELNYPLLYLYRRRTMDSGGGGRGRGGVSGEVAMTAHGTQAINVSMNTVGSNHTSTSGVAGGYPGGGATGMLVRGSDLAQRWARHELPQAVSELAGECEVLPAKAVFVLRPGDVFVAVPHGGGGLGDPLGREPARVAADVADGLVSREWAGRLYGVALDRDGAVLPKDTEALRRSIRSRRLESAQALQRIVPRPPLPGDPAAARVLGALRATPAGVYCGECCGFICAAGDDPKERLRRRIGEVGSAGPWVARRWSGNSPTVRLWEYFCPHCGGAVAVEQHLSSADRAWRDQG